MTRIRHQVQPEQWNMHGGVRSPWSAEGMIAVLGLVASANGHNADNRSSPNHHVQCPITTRSRLLDKTRLSTIWVENASLGVENVREDSNLCHLE